MGAFPTRGRDDEPRRLARLAMPRMQASLWKEKTMNLYLMTYIPKTEGVLHPAARLVYTIASDPDEAATLIEVAMSYDYVNSIVLLASNEPSKSGEAQLIGPS